MLVKKESHFNLKLISLPKDLIEYIVFHEISHINNKSHNANFWKTISKFFPDYKQKEQQLTGFSLLLKKSKLWNEIERI
ncbi:MAG: M48 family metallopeptidase [Promethearchaeota archaeon]